MPKYLPAKPRLACLFQLPRLAQAEGGDTTLCLPLPPYALLFPLWKRNHSPSLFMWWYVSVYAWDMAAGQLPEAGKGWL